MALATELVITDIITIPEPPIAGIGVPFVELYWKGFAPAPPPEFGTPEPDLIWLLPAPIVPLGLLIELV